MKNIDLNILVTNPIKINTENIDCEIIKNIIKIFMLWFIIIWKLTTPSEHINESEKYS